jgi:hypothetical protein
LKFEERLCASDTLQGSAYVVTAVAPGTVYRAEKPGDGRLNAALPPIDVRLHVTARLVDAGLAPGVTVALRVVGLPAWTGFGLADPVAVGAEDELDTTRLMLKVPERLWESVTVQGSE